MKIEIDSDDIKIDGGDYSNVYLCQGNNVGANLSGKDFFWFIRVRRRTSTHNVISKFMDAKSEIGFSETKYDLAKVLLLAEVYKDNNCSQEKTLHVSMNVLGESPLQRAMVSGILQDVDLIWRGEAPRNCLATCGDWIPKILELKP